MRFDGETRSRPEVTLLVTDLDNTLWDWFEIWFYSFDALLTAVVEQTGVARSILEAEIREVHQRRGTSEYTYLLDELPSLQSLYPKGEIASHFAEAIHAFRSARKARSRLYPGVLDTLRAVRDRGTLIVAYTESLGFVSASRLRRLGLDGVVQYLYSPADHDFPQGVTAAHLRTQPDCEYGLTETIHRHTPPGILKPEAAVLEGIVGEFGARPEKTVYVGDSLMKDVLMAQRVGVHDVLAVYGAVQHRAEYELLRRVSHWSDEDVQREIEMSEQPPTIPTFRLESSFAELSGLFEFSSP